MTRKKLTGNTMRRRERDYVHHCRASRAATRRAQAIWAKLDPGEGTRARAIIEDLEERADTGLKHIQQTRPTTLVGVRERILCDRLCVEVDPGGDITIDQRPHDPIDGARWDLIQTILRLTEVMAKSPQAVAALCDLSDQMRALKDAIDDEIKRRVEATRPTRHAIP